MGNQGKEEYLQWHPAFYAGMQIELKEEAVNLMFENEHQLGTKPLGIDILIIKKNVNIPVCKNIGRIFKGDQKMCKALEELMEERIVEREQKAKIEARAEDILFFLEECGEIPKKLQELILGEMDMAVLERWLKIAGKVKSIEEFQNAI